MSISVWNLLPDGRGCTSMPCPQEVSSLCCLWESSEVALPAGTPLPWGFPLAKEFFPALFSTVAKDVCFKEPMNLPQESLVLGLHVLLIKIAFNF